MGDEKRGRLGLNLHYLSWFTDPENPVQPFENELAIDDTTGDIVRAHQKETGEWVWLSRTAEIQDFLDGLSDSGIFTNAAAFVKNRIINRFFFDQDNGECRIDPERTYPELYRYYAIRKTSLGPNGEYQYITGVKGDNPDGKNVISSLVDMVVIDNPSGDGTKVSVPQVGGIVDEVINGDPYIVEFFDNDRKLVSFDSYQAIAVRIADYDLAPDTAVTDIYVQTNQNFSEDENSCYLYRNQDISNLEIEVRLKYADGRTRSVSHEQVSGGRLNIEGLDSISTDEITTENDTPQTFEVIYQMVRDNSTLPGSVTDTETGGVINPQTLTISKTIKVYVIEDVYNNLETIIPCGYVEKDSSDQQYKIKLRFFGHYSNGSVNDITNIVSYTSAPLIENSFGQTQNLAIKVPYGNAGLFKTMSFTLLAPTVTDETSSRRVIINDQGSRYIVSDNTATGGGIYSGKFEKFTLLSTGGSGIGDEVSLSTLKELATYKDKVPTHIRIRDVKDSKYLYSDLVTGDSGVYFKDDKTGHEITKDRLVLVEFFVVNTDDKQNAISVFETGAIPHLVSVKS